MLPRSKGEKQSTPRTVPMQVLALGFPRTGTTCEFNIISVAV
jgi:hypothetical protein